MTEDITDKIKLLRRNSDISEARVNEILDEFEREGIVWKRWDVKRNEYVYFKTEFGHQLAKKMGIDCEE